MFFLALKHNDDDFFSLELFHSSFGIFSHFHFYIFRFGGGNLMKKNNNNKQTNLPFWIIIIWWVVEWKKKFFLKKNIYHKINNKREEKTKKWNYTWDHWNIGDIIIVLNLFSELESILVLSTVDWTWILWKKIVCFRFCSCCCLIVVYDFMVD